MCIYHLQTRCRNSHVMVYHGPFQIATFWEFLHHLLSLWYIFFDNKHHMTNKPTLRMGVKSINRKQIRQVGISLLQHAQLNALGSLGTTLATGATPGQVGFVGYGVWSGSSRGELGSGVGHGGQPQSRQFLGGYVIC